jgi:hypothetical protein
VTVTASNSAGEGAASEAATATPAGPPSDPRDVTVEASESGDLSVSWLAPLDDGGDAVTGYTATATLVTSSADLGRASVEGGVAGAVSSGSCDTVAPDTSCTITGLTPGAQYEVTVRAFNGVGESDADGGPDGPVTVSVPSPSPSPTTSPSPSPSTTVAPTPGPRTPTAVPAGLGAVAGAPWPGLLLAAICAASAIGVVAVIVLARRSGAGRRRG